MVYLKVFFSIVPGFWANLYLFSGWRLIALLTSFSYEFKRDFW